MKSIWELQLNKKDHDRPEIVMHIKSLFHCHVRMTPTNYIPGVMVCWGNYRNDLGNLCHKEDYHYLFCGPNAKIGGRT